MTLSLSDNGSSNNPQNGYTPRNRNSSVFHAPDRMIDVAEDLFAHDMAVVVTPPSDHRVEACREVGPDRRVDSRLLA